MIRYIKKVYSLLICVAYRLVFLAISYVPVFRLYQPVFSHEHTDNGVIRNSRDRWIVMKPCIEGIEKGSVLDIGSNIGYFTFQTAALGHYATGVEAEDFNVTMSNAIKVCSGSENAHFIKGLITPETTKVMPHYNTIINLSVFHHWVKAYGEKMACGMMRDLASKCDHLIFETGQADEKGTKWAEKLSFMGDKPQAWTENFLKDIGFSKVTCLGQFATGLTDVKRSLFFASK